MNETIFLQYYWVVPSLWVTLIILNRLLGNHIVTINSNLLRPEKPEGKSQRKTKINLIFILRALLAFPVMIGYWWIFTRFFKFQEIYLLLAGYHLFSYINAITIQLSSLFPQYLLLKPDNAFNEDQLQRATNALPIIKAGEYFGYFIIYLFIVFLTRSWFIAGGLISCIFAIGKHLINARKIAKTRSIPT